MTEEELDQWEREAKKDTFKGKDIYDRIEYRDQRSERILSLISVIRILRQSLAELQVFVTKFQIKEEHIASMQKILKHADAAMTYAYEDHSDQYYLNVQEQIREALNLKVEDLE